MNGFLFRGKRIDNGQLVESHSLVKIVSDSNKDVEYFLCARNSGNVAFDSYGNITGFMGYFEKPIMYKVVPETIVQVMD